MITPNSIPSDRQLLRNDDAGQTPEVGVGSDELGLAYPRSGVNDGIRGVETVLHSEVPCRKGDGFIQGDDAAGEGLGNEPYGDGPAALLAELLKNVQQG